MHQNSLHFIIIGNTKQLVSYLKILFMLSLEKRLREYFSTGYIIAPEVAEEDLHIAKQLSDSV